jgi:uncharacterized membrane protein YcaP (DUF421 family)
MWTLSVPWWQFVLRAIIVYAFLTITLRLTGKRQIGQLAPFDLVLLLMLSNAVQNAMNAGDNSITGGIILCLTLVILNALVSLMTYKSKQLEYLIEGRPEIIIHNGILDEKKLKKMKMTHHELHSALRKNGCLSVDDVKVAVLENNGELNVVRKDDCQKQVEV